MADCMRTLNESGLREAVERARAQAAAGRVRGRTDAVRPQRGRRHALPGDLPGRGASLRRPATRPSSRARARPARPTPARPAPRRPAPGAQVPHMGWNKVRQTRSHPVWAGIPDETHFYFVHSYYADPADPGLTVGETDYGVSFTCAVAAANIFAVQFRGKERRTRFAPVSQFCRLAAITQAQACRSSPFNSFLSLPCC